MESKTPGSVVIVGIILLFFLIAIVLAYLIAFSGNPSSENNVNITVENNTNEELRVIICEEIEYTMKGKERINIEATKGINFNIRGYLKGEENPTFQGNILIANEYYRGKREIRIDSINKIYRTERWNDQENVVSRYNCETKDNYIMEIRTKCGVQTQNKRQNGQKHEKYFSCKNLNSYVINFLPPLK